MGQNIKRLKECRGQDSNLRSNMQRSLNPPPLTTRVPRLCVEAFGTDFLTIPLEGFPPIPMELVVDGDEKRYVVCVQCGSALPVVLSAVAR